MLRGTPIQSFPPILSISTTWSIPLYSGTWRAYFAAIPGLRNLYNAISVDWGRGLQLIRSSLPSTYKMSSLEIFGQWFGCGKAYKRQWHKVLTRPRCWWSTVNVPRWWCINRRYRELRFFEYRDDRRKWISDFPGKAESYPLQIRGRV